MKQRDIRSAFGHRVRELRAARDWSQEKMAEATGLHWTYIGQTERGERNLTLRSIRKLPKVSRLRWRSSSRGWADRAGTSPSEDVPNRRDRRHRTYRRDRNNPPARATPPQHAKTARAGGPLGATRASQRRLKCRSFDSPQAKPQGRSGFRLQAPASLTPATPAQFTTQLKTMKAYVTVMLKTTVLDPQGKTIHGALNKMGYKGVGEVRQGKFFELTLKWRPGQCRRQGRDRAHCQRGAHQPRD